MAAGKKDSNNNTIVEKLNGLLEFELSGITRYLHYSFMVFGPNRIPITGWLRAQADDGMKHATECGESGDDGLRQELGLRRVA